jgi:hypothetical protein
MNSIIPASFPIFTRLRYNRHMMDFAKLFPQNLYHSYVIEGDPKITGELLLQFLEKRSDAEKKGGDVLFQVYESFTMDDSGEIKNWHSRKGIGKSKKICIIATKFINREAEQTLLKIIEEPAENTHFFIIVPNASVLLDTIISRTHVIKTPARNAFGIADARPHDSLQRVGQAGGKQTSSGENKDIQKEALLFISLSPKTRIDKVAVMVKENKSEESSGELRFFATSFINELENIFYQKFKKNINDEKSKFVLDELQKARGYLSTSGASVKMILEHLALVI